MKRKAPASKTTLPRKPKKKCPEVPDYHLTPTLKDDKGQPIWPAPADQIQNARRIILDCARAGETTVICPDKDADGLSSGVILHRTLTLLGLSPDLISVQLLAKGTTIFSQSERDRLAALDPAFVFVLDHGSRAAPPLLQTPHTTLVVDHHHATPSDFPQGSAFVTACNSPPVVTTSLLIYLICEQLHASVREQCDWLAVMGTYGDLGTTFKWEPPFPDMTSVFKTYTKLAIQKAVSAVNAPRRTATHDVSSAWLALLTATTPKEVLQHQRLHDARDEVSAEVDRCSAAAPKFSSDGRVAAIRIRSGCQIHPIIAIRWANRLDSKALQFVMVANEAYLPGKVNFSCRVARSARARGDEVDLIRSLKEYASLEPNEKEPPSATIGHNGTTTSTETETSVEPKLPLLERLGDDFARGHVHASGGVVPTAEFDELYALMRFGKRFEVQKRREEEDAKGGGGPSPSKTKKIDTGQTNTLTRYFGKKAEADAA